MRSWTKGGIECLVVKPSQQGGAGGLLIANGIANEDDAALMAAAPELLAACKEAVAALEWADPYHETGLTVEERHAEAVTAINAAIAKATGEPTNG